MIHKNRRSFLNSILVLQNVVVVLTFHIQGSRPFPYHTFSAGPEAQNKLSVVEMEVAVERSDSVLGLLGEVVPVATCCWPVLPSGVFRLYTSTGTLSLGGAKVPLGRITNPDPPVQPQVLQGSRAMINLYLCHELSDQLSGLSGNGHMHDVTAFTSTVPIIW